MKKNLLRHKEADLRLEQKNLLTENSNFFVREAYKTLRTNVSFALSEAEGCKVIVVTSSVQGEGKSSTAANLAISYAMADSRVLIIDCDLRRPKLSRLLQLSAQAGLSNLLVNPALLPTAILPGPVDGMDVILAGDVPPNPSELLGSSRMHKLIVALRERYDYIILDSPPVNMVTDAVVLAPQSDGVLFLVRANHSERGAVIHAVEQLEYAKAKILGFVLNDIGMEKTHYYGGHRYHHYGYGYGYGYEAKTQEAEEE